MNKLSLIPLLGIVLFSGSFLPNASGHGTLDVETIFSFTSSPFNFCTNIVQVAVNAEQDFIPNVNEMVAIDVELRALTLASVHPVTINIYDGSLPITAANNLLGTTFADLGYPALNTFGTVHFDFTPPVPLTAGQPHVIEYTVNDGSSFIDLSATSNNVIPGQFSCFSIGSSLEYLFATYFGQAIGGEIIPIETTSLLLAGAQSFSWMIPVVLSILGIGLVLVRKK